MTAEKINITTPFIKLDSFLKLCGEAQTGGHAKALIAEGQVIVDGWVCHQRGKKLYTGAVIVLEERQYEVVSG